MDAEGGVRKKGSVGRSSVNQRWLLQKRNERGKGLRPLFDQSPHSSITLSLLFVLYSAMHGFWTPCDRCIRLMLPVRFVVPPRRTSQLSLSFLFAFRPVATRKEKQTDRQTDEPSAAITISRTNSISQPQPH